MKKIHTLKSEFNKDLEHTVIKSLEFKSKENTIAQDYKVDSEMQ